MQSLVVSGVRRGRGLSQFGGRGLAAGFEVAALQAQLRKAVRTRPRRLSNDEVSLVHFYSWILLNASIPISRGRLGFRQIWSAPPVCNGWWPFFSFLLLASYLNCVWCFHLTEQHKSHHLERCETALQVPMIYGAMVEAMITFLSRYVALHSERWDTHVANYTNSIGSSDSTVSVLRTLKLISLLPLSVTAILCVVGEHRSFWAQASEIWIDVNCHSHNCEHQH